MRIVGGRFKRRKLKTPQGLSTRPTAEKVREALFDILGPRIEGVLFIDLYAGTGAVGIEALSRGAEKSVFVENAGRAVSALKSNIDSMPIEMSEVHIIKDSVSRALKLLKEMPYEASIVFSDPPYSDEGWPVLMSNIRETLSWKEDGLLIVEHHRKMIPGCPDGFKSGKTYVYGDTALSFFYVKTGG